MRTEKVVAEIELPCFPNVDSSRFIAAVAVFVSEHLENCFLFNVVCEQISAQSRQF